MDAGLTREGRGPTPVVYFKVCLLYFREFIRMWLLIPEEQPAICIINIVSVLWYTVYPLENQS